MPKVKISWLSKEQGGRVSGPPVGARYSCTIVFCDEDEHPEEGAQHHSAVLELAHTQIISCVAEVRFLVPRNVEGFMRVASVLQLMEGPRVVGIGEIDQL